MAGRSTPTTAQRLGLASLLLLLTACPAPTLVGSQPATTPGASPVPVAASPSPTGQLTPQPVVPDAGQRSLVDRPDEVEGLQIHPVYVLPPGATDYHLDTSGAIHESLMRVNAWFKEQTGGRTLRLDTIGGKADVTFHPLDAPVPSGSDSNAVLEHVASRLQAAGLEHPQKLLLILFGDNLHTDWTGVGGNLRALVQVIPTGQWPAPGARFDGLDKIVAHELLHALGAVPDGAPHRGDGYHATDDPHDVMTARPDRSAPWILDVGRDDYYGHGRADLHDVARSYYWEPVPADAAPWAGQPLAWTPGAAPTALPQAAVTSDPDLEPAPLATLRAWRLTAGQQPLTQDRSLQRLLSRYLDGAMGQPEATTDDLRFASLYGGNYHVWRQHGRLAPGGDPGALLQTMAERALANGGDALVGTALTGMAAVCRRQDDDLWLAIGVGDAPFEVQAIRLGDGPFNTYTLSGQVVARSGTVPVHVGNDADLGYARTLSSEAQPFYVSVPKDRAQTLRIRTWDGSGWIGPALVRIDGRRPKDSALGPASETP